ncbi:MAG: DUF6101 family protein [Pseudomonadota bacterium]
MIAASLPTPANDPLPSASEGVPMTLPASLHVGRRERAVSVDISHEAVTIRRPFEQTPPTTASLSSYRGVAVTVERGVGEPLYHLTLCHDDAERSVNLASGTDVTAIARDWQAWAKMLSLPLVAVEADGTVHAELTALGVILAERPFPRRKGSALVGRRSRYGRRRRSAPVRNVEGTSFSGEREIIART